jgi:phosphohistidine swiveling domain-containing protein
MLEVAKRSEPGAAREAVLFGVGASAGVARGPARVVRSRAELGGVGPADVLVVDALPTRWIAALPSCRAVVAQTGGVLQFSARALRERTTPAVVGARGVLALVEDGDEVEVDGFSGIVRIVGRV